MEEKILEQINKNIELLTRVLLKDRLQGKSTSEAIRYLGDIGFASKEIEKLTGAKANVIQVRLSEMKAKKKGKKEA